MMTHAATSQTLRWENATGLMPFSGNSEVSPVGMLVPDAACKKDHVAVVYEKGQIPPEITIEQVSSSVHTVLANGVAVAIVARAEGPAPSAEEVLLVERAL